MMLNTLSVSEKELVRGSGKGRFLYHQLADLIRHDIETGVLRPHEKLPSMDILAREYELNKSTVRQAVAQLTQEGLVETIPARGTFVCDQSHQSVMQRKLVIGWLSAIDDQGVTGSYHVEMMNAARDLIQECGGHLVVMSAVGVEPKQFLQSVKDARLDGAILLGPAEMDPLKQLLDTAVPVVLIDSKPSGHCVNCILADNEAGGFQAVNHLLQLGHRSLAFVTGPKDWRITRERLTGAFEAINQLDEHVHVATVESDLSPEGGASAMRELMARKNRPTGIFFFNDEMASAGLQVAHELTDVSVPLNVSVVGFDNIYWSSMTHPSLTTVHVEKALMGQKAIERLNDIIETPDQIPLTMVMPTRLMVRKSTTPLCNE